MNSSERKIAFENIQIGRNQGLDPITYNKKHNMWEVIYFESFPQGGYSTKEHAQIALGIWKAKPELNYKDLYRISEFVYKGLQ